MFCQKCKNSGYITVVDKTTSEEIAKLCDCRKEEILRKSWERELKKSGIPALYHFLRLDDYKKSNVYALNAATVGKIEKYFEDPENFNFGMYLISQDKNCGKTTLLCYIGKRFLLEGKQVFYITLEQLYDLYLEVIMREKVKSEKWEKINDSQVILIDDAFDDDRFNIDDKDDRSNKIYNCFSRLLQEDKHLFLAGKLDIKKIKNPALQSLIERYFYPLILKGEIKFDLSKKLRL